MTLKEKLLDLQHFFVKEKIKSLGVDVPQPPKPPPPPLAYDLSNDMRWDPAWDKEKKP